MNEHRAGTVCFIATILTVYAALGAHAAGCTPEARQAGAQVAAVGCMLFARAEMPGAEQLCVQLPELEAAIEAVAAKTPPHAKMHRDEAAHRAAVFDEIKRARAAKAAQQ
jgi:hypothetical protein